MLHFASALPISARAKLRLTKATLALAEVVDFEAVATKEKNIVFGLFKRNGESTQRLSPNAIGYTPGHNP